MYNMSNQHLPYKPGTTGGEISRPDPRDDKWSLIGAAIAPFDWNKGYDIQQVLGIPIKTKDQGVSLSCGGQMTSYYG